MTGLYSDTGGFTYLNDNYEKTLDLVKELIKEGIKVEQIRNKLNQYTMDHLRVVNELFANIQNGNDYTYSCISDDFVNYWLEKGKSFSSLQIGTKIFTDYYLRNIEGRPWGFIVYPDPLLGDGCYSVSLRALNGYKDVASLANKVGGGGHKAAAGAKIKAASSEEACRLIITSITN
jgi:bifunctional oligoribonuclease and PAP phosphatase NrnA